MEEADSVFDAEIADMLGTNEDIDVFTVSSENEDLEDEIDIAFGVN